MATKKNIPSSRKASNALELDAAALERERAALRLYGAWSSMASRPPSEGRFTHDDALRAVTRIEAFCAWARSQISEGVSPRVEAQLRAMNEAIDRVRSQPAYRAADLRNMITSYALAVAPGHLDLAEVLPLEQVVNDVFGIVRDYARSLSAVHAQRLESSAASVRQAIQLVPQNRRRAIFLLRNVLDDKQTANTKEARRDAERAFASWESARRAANVRVGDS